jgi:hypothetical protein
MSFAFNPSIEFSKVSAVTGTNIRIKLAFSGVLFMLRISVTFNNLSILHILVCSS